MASDSVVDTNKLRNALRLVHCLQKERGSSCAYYANTNAAFESAMLEARAASDSSVQLMRGAPTTTAAGQPQQHHRRRRPPDDPDLPVASSLRKIRSLIDGSSARSKGGGGGILGNPQDPSNDLIFHRIFVCFNALISSIVHGCILKSLGSDDDVVVAPGGAATTKSTLKQRHKRGFGADFDGNHLRCDSAPATPERRNGNRTTAGTAPADRAAAGTTLQGSKPEETAAMADTDGGSGGDQDHPASPESNHESVLESGPLQDTEPAPASPRPPVQQQLLDLLHLFVQLKESAGVERAILSSLLAFRNHRGTMNDLPSLRMLTNDLIMEVENQRALYHLLKRLPSGPHHALVLELAKMSPRLLDLQQIILTDCDSLEGLEYDCEAIWDLITLYIDKLHSVELLIIEDLECTMPVSALEESSAASEDPGATPSSTPIDMLDVALEQMVVANVDGEEWKHNLLAEIELMSADSLKERVKEFLQSTCDKEVGTTISAVSSNYQSQNGGDVSSSHHASMSNHSLSQSHSSTADSAAEPLKEDVNQELINRRLDKTASKEWEISIYEINFTKRIGQGASATTYLGKWTNQNVAVKVASITEFGLEGWRTEVNALQRLHHPNVIRLMGSVYNESPQTHCLVLEYCNAGDLATALRYPTPRNFFFHVSSSIANAMSYLHKRGIMHRDLKPANILCDGNISSGNFVVKITDFGIATEISRSKPRSTDAHSSMAASGMDEQESSLTGETGTYRWMSPEVIRHENYSSMADVYSYAIMLWQFITHEVPFFEVGAVDAARLTAIEKERPPMPKETPDAVVDIIQSNWSDNPNQRWEFSKIVERLQQLDGLLSGDEVSWLEEPHGHPVYAHEDVTEEIIESSAQPKTGGRRRDSKQNKKGTNRRGGKSSLSPKRNPSPGRKPNLLSSFFSQRKKGTSVE